MESTTLKNIEEEYSDALIKSKNKQLSKEEKDELLKELAKKIGVKRSEMDKLIEIRNELLGKWEPSGSFPSQSSSGRDWIF